MSFFLNVYNTPLAVTVYPVDAIPVVIPPNNFSSSHKLFLLCRHFCVLEKCMNSESRILFSPLTNCIILGNDTLLTGLFES